MHLVLNATAYDGVPSGARNRATGLAAAALRSGVRVTVLAPRGLRLAPLVAAEQGVAGDRPEGAWTEVATDLDPRRPFERFLRAGRELLRALPRDADAFVTDYYPVLPDVPTVLTVHDLRALVRPDEAGAARAAWFRAFYPGTARAARLVVTPSAAVRADVVARVGVPEASVRVVPNGLGRAWREPGASATVPVHLLLVGAADPRKDAGTVFDALRRAAARGRVLPLVVASRDGAHLRRERGRAADLTTRGLLRFVEAPDDAALVSLARDAAALLHPSRYEGFAMTVLEGLAAGLPVVAAEEPAVRELAAGFVQFLHAGDVNAWAEALLRFPRAVPDRAARRVHAVRFTWDAACEALLAALRDPGRIPVRTGSVARTNR